jgi:hypothetical protein
MHIFTSLLRSFSCLLGLLVMSSTTCFAQLEYATKVVAALNTTNAAEAADASPYTGATLTPSLLAGDARLRLGFASPAAPGTRAGIRILPGEVLSAAALNSIQVRTYASTVSTTTPAQTFTLGSLVQLSGLGTDTTVVDFPVSKAFDQLEVVAANLLNVSYEVEVFDAFAREAPLPVELTSFQARAQAASVLLEWTTASQTQAAYIEVQRASAALGLFTALGRVPSAGTTTHAQHDQFVDRTAHGFCYYRLRQVDLDGHETFSPVVAVTTTAASALTVYPTLATTQLTIDAPQGTPLGVFDQLGRQWQQFRCSSQPLNIAPLPSGVYFVRDLATGRSSRFVKGTDAAAPH